MTSLKGLDIKFTKRDFEDVEEWCERMFMAAAMREYKEEKLLFTAQLNLEDEKRSGSRTLKESLAVGMTSSTY